MTSKVFGKRVNENMSVNVFTHLLTLLVMPTVRTVTPSALILLASVTGLTPKLVLPSVIRIRILAASLRM